MDNTTEKRTVVKVKGKITRVNILPGEESVEIFSIGNCTKDQIEITENFFDERFPIVRASTLSLEDSFLKHKTQTDRQKRLKDSIILGIKLGLKDFRRPAMDPSLDNDGNIVYMKGMSPAMEETPSYWDRLAKEFMPENNSRIGNLLQYDAFLGILIKYLIEERGYTVADAWKEVCDDSKDLGHYMDSNSTKHILEPTGKRRVGMFFDLANTYKIVRDDSSKSEFSRVGGFFCTYGKNFTLADVKTNIPANAAYNYRVPWIVLDV